MPTLEFKNSYIQAVGTSVGPLEAAGPLGKEFDHTYDNLHCNQKTWERAERQLMRDCIDTILIKADMNIHEVEMLIAGDLLNQTTTTNYLARDLNIPFLGVYNACSTSTEALLLAAVFVDNHYVKNVICGASSHNATAERQFRYPTEYGGCKKLTTTFTATAAGMALVSTKGDIKITSATIGRVMDWKQKDAADMGSAMAPAAYDTITTHLKNRNETVNDYDLILTGDLSDVGTKILKELFERDQIQLTNHNDCGLLLYDRNKQQVFAGGSGAGCAPSVTFSYIYRLMKEKQLKKVLVCATGALFSPVSMQQKETIPSICHAVALEVV